MFKKENIIFTIFFLVFFSSTTFGQGFWCNFGFQCDEIPSHRIIENGGVHYEIGKNTPFSGTTVEYKNEEIYIKKKFKKGIFYLKERYFNETLRTSLQFKNKKPHGEWKVYTNKKVTELGFYKNGKATGTWIHYDEDGEIEERMNFEDYGNGLISGYYQSGKLNQKGYVKDGEPFGKWKYYHENGQLSAEINYKDGEYHGLYKSFHKNGKLKTKVKNQEGESHGLYISFHENGKLRTKFNYIYGKPEDGTVTIFHDNGKYDYNATYLNGRRNGLVEWFYENGKIKQKGNYIKGKLDGDLEKFNEDGSKNLD